VNNHVAFDSEHERTLADTGDPAVQGAVAQERRTAAGRRVSPWVLSRRIIGPTLTLAALAAALLLSRELWRSYTNVPWTRDATVRAYVVTMAPEVSGRIVRLEVKDDQFVRKGDLLMVIDPRDYRIAVTRNEALLRQASLAAQNSEREARRREALTQLDAIALEQTQNYENTAQVEKAQALEADAALQLARTNLVRTRIRSPVNGWVTNLLAQANDFASVGENEVSIVNADSFWIDAYFEETQLGSINVGDSAIVRLMGYRSPVHGHVESISRGIDVPNAQPSVQGLATVNPIFTWVRLAQRIPVRIHIDSLPPGVTLVAGLTATVHILPRSSAAERADR
jgi:multidrug resistance efflux pump